MCSQEVLILVNQSIKDVEDAIISLLFSRSIYSCPQTPCANGSNNYRQLQIKKRGCLHLPALLFWPTTANSKRTNRETPTLEYIDTRKVCVEDTRPSQHTTESIYYTPWSYPSICLGLLFSIVVVRRVQKQSVSNAF